ncbi:MAG TPA: response regulator, partial [Aggregatilineales bacterium]|nr:response regulator [Aggregatilineales bacterium]
MTDPDPSAARILVVDDNIVHLTLLTDHLKHEGYRVIATADPTTVIDLATRELPDLVLLDAMMPMIDGFTLCGRLRELPRGADLPILIVTALDDDESVDRAFAAGATDYVTKPIHWAVLRQRVRRLIQQQRLQHRRDDLFQMIVHDMKSPLGAIQGFAKITLED